MTRVATLRRRLEESTLKVDGLRRKLSAAVANQRLIKKEFNQLLLDQSRQLSFLDGTSNVRVSK